MNFDLDLNFKEFLISKIPIMKDEELLKLLLEYCNISNDLIIFNTSGSPGSKGTSSIISLKKDKIREINNELNNIKETYTNHTKYLTRTSKENKNNNNENRPKILNLINNESKKIKSHKIETKSLIEAIINCSLNFYEQQSENNNKKIVNSSMSIVSNRMYHIMNNLKGENLGKFIIRIYYSNLSNKNKYLLNLLKEIASILLYLQNECGFIHGDFHSGNIIIIPKNGINNENELVNINDLENNNYKIFFIDFGNSTIRLPLNNDNSLILSTPSDENIKRKNSLDLNKYPSLRGVDLFHLIQSLDSIEKDEFIFEGNMNNEYYNLFKKIIIKIKTMYHFNSFIKINDIYNFTRSNNFGLQNNSILYPQEFINLNINSIEENITPVKINTQKKNNGENRLRRISKSLFNNSNNNNGSPFKKHKYNLNKNL